MKRTGVLTGITAASAFFSLLIPTIHAQPSGKKTYQFRGRVEQVNASPKPLTVTNEPNEGWMGAMTMAYAVNNKDGSTA